MKLIADEKLFWFLKKGAELDLDRSADLELYVQQVLTRGRSQDVKGMLGHVGISRFRETFRNIKPFLPTDIRNFWIDFLANHK